MNEIRKSAFACSCRATDFAYSAEIAAGKRTVVFARFEGYRQIVDNKFIQGFLNDFSGMCCLDKPASQDENQNMTAVEKPFEGFVTSDPEILGGEPVLIGTRLRLLTVLQCYEDGATPEQVFEWYPGASLEVLRRIRSVFRPGVAASH